jgi:exopolyphosphatase / guanosine-5'-triphosphate,3'-diphosphate pyrophosphatase
VAKITAVIDIGSNSIRMQVFKRTSRFGFYLLNESKAKVRLSEKCYQNGGNLQSAAMDRTSSAIGEFLSIASHYQARKILCVATSALRDAPNQKLFIKRILDEHKINIKVIDGNKEAYFGGTAALNLLPKTSGITIDIGGGSTELALLKEGKIVDTISFKLGTVRLKELFFDVGMDLEIACDYVKEELKRLPEHFRSECIIGIGGTMRALATSIMRHTNYPLEVLHAYEYCFHEHESYFEEIIKSRSDRLKRFGFKSERFDVIREGTLIFRSIATLIGAKCVMSSGVGVREGVFLSDLLRTQHGRFPHNFNPSSRSLIDRYEINTKVSSYIVKQCMSLYDTLASVHNMDDSYKEILITAAKLSELGVYINYHGNANHGYHLLFDGLLYGYTHEQRVLIAYIVKNQSKKRIAKFCSKHNDLRTLLPDDAIVKWLSYILYIAKNMNISFSMPQVKYVLIDQTRLSVTSESELYLAKEKLAGIKAPKKLELIID